LVPNTHRDAGAPHCERETASHIGRLSSAAGVRAGPAAFGFSCCRAPHSSAVDLAAGARQRFLLPLPIECVAGLNYPYITVVYDVKCGDGAGPRPTGQGGSD